MIKRITTFLIIYVITISCNTSPSKFNGVWVNKKNDNDIIKIEQQDDKNSFYIYMANYKLEAKLKKNKLEIKNMNNQIIEITPNEDFSMLKSGNVNMIPLKQSKINNYLGVWQKIKGSKWNNPFLKIYIDGAKFKIESGDIINDKFVKDDSIKLFRGSSFLGKKWSILDDKKKTIKNMVDDFGLSQSNDTLVLKTDKNGDFIFTKIKE